MSASSSRCDPAEPGCASWLHLPRQDARFTLAAAGLPDAADCGWVEQMLPFIDALSAPGDGVLDPFCGWGTTLLAAHLRGRHGVGVELDAARAATARRRLAHHGAAGLVLDGNACQLPIAAGVMPLCLTSIPYFSAGRYGAEAGSPDVDTHCYVATDFGHYLALLQRAFAEVARVLRPGGYFVAMVENVRLGERFVPLAWECGRALGQFFELGDERILVYDRARSDSGGLLSNRAHEYALVCRKR